MSKKEYLFCLSDMVANAFIELKVRGFSISDLSIDVIEQYGFEVASKLKDAGNNVYFSLSRTSTDEFEKRHIEYFTVNRNSADEVISISLNDGVEVSDLIEDYRTYLPINLMMTYMDKEIVHNSLLNKLDLSDEKGNVKQLTYQMK